MKKGILVLAVCLSVCLTSCSSGEPQEADTDSVVSQGSSQAVFVDSNNKVQINDFVQCIGGEYGKVTIENSAAEIVTQNSNGMRIESDHYHIAIGLDHRSDVSVEANENEIVNSVIVLPKNDEDRFTPDDMYRSLSFDLIEGYSYKAEDAEYVEQLGDANVLYLLYGKNDHGKDVCIRIKSTELTMYSDGTVSSSMNYTPEKTEGQTAKEYFYSLKSTSEESSWMADPVSLT